MTEDRIIITERTEMVRIAVTEKIGTVREMTEDRAVIIGKIGTIKTEVTEDRVVITERIGIIPIEMIGKIERVGKVVIIPIEKIVKIGTVRETTEDRAVITGKIETTKTEMTEGRVAIIGKIGMDCGIIRVLGFPDYDAVLDVDIPAAGACAVHAMG